MRATFVETENEELNRVLQTIQEKIIFPSYLPAKQQKIVFNPKMRVFMQQNPIVIEVDGEEHKFTPLNRSTDIPNSKKSFHSVMQLMKTPEDFANLGTLLAGYKKACIHLRTQDYGKLIRVASKTGNIYTIIDCAKQAQKTGLKFKTHEMVVGLLAAINNKIIDGGAAATQQAVKWLEVVLDLLHYPEQQAVRGTNADSKIHASRLSRGLVLFTRASAISAKQAAEEDASAELILLKDEVELLKTLWKDADLKNLNSLPEFAVLSPSSKDGALKSMSGSAFVDVVAQNIKALSLAREYAAAEANDLHAVESALAAYLQQTVENDPRRDNTWAEVFERVTGAAPSWSATTSKPAKTVTSETKTEAKAEEA